MKSKRPNIILIQTDQQSAETLGIYGNPVVKTPALERIAAEGVVFDNAFCNYPACVPSRASMMTGRYPHTIRSYANFIHLNPLETSLPEVLKRTGYQTALIGKNHAFTSGGENGASEGCCFYNEVIGGDEKYTDQLHQVFDYVVQAYHGHLVEGYESDNEVMGAHQWAKDNCWSAPMAFGKNPYPKEKCGSYLLGKCASEYIRNAAEKDTPFFLWLSYPDPHTPYQAPEPYASMYDPNTIPLPPEDCLENKPERQKVANIMDSVDKADKNLLRQVKAIHYGMINAIDDSIGMVMEALSQMELTESTIIVFTADHGDSMGAHGLIQKHNCFYDSITRIPFLLAWPTKIKPGRCDGFIELVDVMPTVLQLAGIDIPYGVQGKSHASYLLGSTSEAKDFAVIESGEDGTPLKVSDITVRPETPFDDRYFVWCAYREAWFGRGKSIRTRKWKLNIYANGDGELYNMQDDPNELVNLYGRAEYADVVAQLTYKLLIWCINTEDRIPDNSTMGLNYQQYLNK